MKRLPKITAHERMDFKRCEMKWFWHWRKGLRPKAISFGALELGTWVHLAFEHWYQKGRRRDGSLPEWFAQFADEAIQEALAAGAPDHAIEQAEELLALGELMMKAYETRYGLDSDVIVLSVEIPLDFLIPSWATEEIIAVHKLRPDMVFMDGNGDVWLMEHKTAKTISTTHLPIDDQARPYGAMAEPALRKAGVINRRHRFRGIMYNFVRKSLPDDRPEDAQGRKLNLNGTLSKRQPSPQFVRHAVTLSKQAKLVTLNRVRTETQIIAQLGDALRSGEITRAVLKKTPHKSCVHFCPFFDMCVADENGADIRMMEKAMYRKENPYLYQETAAEYAGFEMG